MPRNEIEIKAYLDELARVVNQMPTILLNSKNSMQSSFNTMIAYRDDPDSPANYSTIIQEKIDAGKALVQTMLDNVG